MCRPALGHLALYDQVQPLEEIRRLSREEGPVLGADVHWIEKENVALLVDASQVVLAVFEYQDLGRLPGFDLALRVLDRHIQRRRRPT